MPGRRRQDPYRDPAYAQAARARAAGHGIPNPYAERTPVVVNTSAQFRAAIAGREVRALPSATRRRVTRRVRRARRTATRHLAGLGLLVLLVGLVAAVAAAYGYAAS